MDRQSLALQVLQQLITNGHGIFLLIDGELILHEKGETLFEKREPGCSIAFFKAFDYAIRHVGEKFILAHILEYHRLVMTDVEGSFDVKPQQVRSLNELHQPFCISKNCRTKAGVLECFNEKMTQFDLIERSSVMLIFHRELTDELHVCSMPERVMPWITDSHQAD